MTFTIGEGFEPCELKTYFGQFVVEQRNQFQVREGRALLSTHANFRDAEDAALRYWLGPKAKGHDEDARLA